MSEVQIEGFNTFIHEDGFEEVVHAVRIDMCEETGNYFVELIGKELGGTYTIDSEEFINFKGVLIYLQYLGRDYEYMMDKLNKFLKSEEIEDENNRL